jgi:hypothetical protein
MKQESITLLIQGAGLGQLALVGVGAMAPRLLQWGKHFDGLPPIIRQMYWTYGGYILATNLFYGILCLGFPEILLAGSPGAIAFCIYLLLFWLGRIVIQFTYFDRTALGTGTFFKFCEAGVVTLSRALFQPGVFQILGGATDGTPDPNDLLAR